MNKTIKAMYWEIQKHPVYLGMVTGIIVIVVSGLILYHLTSQTQHNLVIECRNLGEKINKEISPQNASLLDPEFYYNPKLKKCFYCGGYMSDGYMVKIIIDAYTNKEITSYTRSLKQPSTDELMAGSQFEYKKRKLFNEK